MIINRILFLIFIIILFFNPININVALANKEIKILITPLDIKGSQDKAYLSGAITQILISRINKPGEITVSEIKAPTAKTRDKKTGEIFNYLEIAQNKNAHFLITGKIFSTNNENKIDIFLFNTQNNQPEYHFDYKSDNLDDLIPRLNEFSQSTVNLVKYINSNQEKFHTNVATEKSSETQDKPMLLTPVSPENKGNDDSYRSHPDRLMRSGKAQQMAIEDRKKILREKNTKIKDDTSLRPTLSLPNYDEKNIDKKEKKGGFLSKIGINIPSENFETPRQPPSSEPFMEKQKLISNLSISDGNNTFENQKPMLLSPMSKIREGQLSKYPSYKEEFQKRDTPSMSGLPFPAPEEVKPIGRDKNTEKKIPDKITTETFNTQHTNPAKDTSIKGTSYITSPQDKSQKDHEKSDTKSPEKNKNPKWNWL